MKKALKITHICLLLIISILFVTSFYFKIYFSSMNFEEIVFYLQNGINNSDSTVFLSAIKVCFPSIIYLFVILYILFYDIFFCKRKILDKKGKQVYPFIVILKNKTKITIFILIIAIISLFFSVNFHNYLIYNALESNFIEENYVNPRNTQITFKNKRNLIIIFVESLETSLFTKEQGGSWNYEVIPELYKLLSDNDTIVFYNKNISQMINMIQGSSWTTASIVANTSSLPLKIRIDKNEYHSKNFLNGSYSLGDLLSDNGYYNELISSADTSFGGIKEYYEKHGNFNIIDINNLKKYDLKIQAKDISNWGFNDKYLFDIAKTRLTEISKSDQPFNLNLITIDTHFFDGYIGWYSKDIYDTQYENAYATTSKLIYDFVSWIKEQPYYEDTTIMIVGDHLSMQDYYFKERGVIERYVYSCIINPKNKIENKKNRIITALDTYPTIVDAIGGEIQGNKLGLGVNLFSNEQTLAEKYGLKKLDYELRKKSTFYNRELLNDDYLKIIK